MIDYGLLMSVIVVIAAVKLGERYWPLQTVEGDRSYLDVAMWPAVAGLAVGRLSTLALDDRSSIGRVRDMAVIRSGVEFWPGLLAASAVAAWAARRANTGISERLADLAPLTLIGYGAYEAACIFRDGCFGPLSPLGLRPDGMDARMFPIGIAMGVASVVAAVGVRRLRADGRPSAAVVAFALACLGLIKATGSIWLPHVGTGPTRQQATSLVVAVGASLACAAILALDQDQTEPTGAAP